VVGSKWVFTIKYNSDGSIARHKARLVAQGFTQTHGIDYDETFAPIAKLNSIHVLLSIATNLDWELHQLDIKNTFLNGDVEKEIYMKAPPGFEENGKVCRLKKSLYRLKQSPRAWFRRFISTLNLLGYKQGHLDHTFTKHATNGSKTILIVYVDDIIITCDNYQEIKTLKGQVQ